MVTRDDVVRDIGDRVPQAVSLGVGRIAADGGITGSKLNLGADAAEAFREHCRGAQAAIEGSSFVSYTSGAEIGDDEVFLIDDPDTIGELAALGDLRTSIETMPTIKPADLDLSIQLYGIVAGDDDRRVLFVRRTNPTVPHGAGRFLAIGRDRLTRLDQPAFSFSARFDFIIGDGWVIVLDQRSFETLFRRIGLVERNISRWIGGITKHLPMDPADIDALRHVAMQDSRTWRQLREIEQRGHLADVDLPQVRHYASLVGIDPDAVVIDDKLVFDPTTRFSFLHLLNEDLYKGQLTDALFEAHRKTPAAP